jgi:hypothetical protein
MTFFTLVAGHAAASVFAAVCAYQVLCAGGPEWLGEGIFYPFFLPLVLLGQSDEAIPDVDSWVGVPPESALGPVLSVSFNSLLWVACAYGLWLAGGWAWRKAVGTGG